jgi:hypothetical protein
MAKFSTSYYRALGPTTQEQRDELGKRTRAKQLGSFPQRTAQRTSTNLAHAPSGPAAQAGSDYFPDQPTPRFLELHRRIERNEPVKQSDFVYEWLKSAGHQNPYLSPEYWAQVGQETGVQVANAFMDTST